MWHSDGNVTAIKTATATATAAAAAAAGPSLTTLVTLNSIAMKASPWVASAADMPPGAPLSSTRSSRWCAWASSAATVRAALRATRTQRSGEGRLRMVNTASPPIAESSVGLYRPLLPMLPHLCRLTDPSTIAASARSAATSCATSAASSAAWGLSSGTAIAPRWQRAERAVVGLPPMQAWQCMQPLPPPHIKTLTRLRGVTVHGEGKRGDDIEHAPAQPLRPPPRTCGEAPRGLEGLVLHSQGDQQGPQRADAAVCLQARGAAGAAAATLVG